LVLQHGDLTPELLERFAKDLESLPRIMVWDTAFEEKAAYERLRGMATYPAHIYGVQKTKILYPLIKFLNFFLIDYNIAGRRLTERLNTFKGMSGNSAINRTVMKKYIDSSAAPHKLWCWNCMMEPILSGRILHVPLIRTRSRLIADACFNAVAPDLLLIQDVLDRSNAKLDLLRLAVALKRYKSANEKYPETLDALLPRYLEEVPLDVFTGRKTLTYRCAPDEATAFLLYSYGVNELDDGGDEKEDCVLRLAAEQ
jgi:hypothetical protein